MSDPLVLSHSESVTVFREVNGVEMGVLADGQSYVTARGLARLCGVAASAVITQGKRWLDGDRASKLARMLTERGIARDSIYIAIERDGTTVHAYTDDVAHVILEYYAFEATPPSKVGLANFRTLSQAGLRVFVYQALGYDPSRRLSDAWRQFHDRLNLHQVPRGYFSVFRECADFVLASIRAGLPVDDHTIPDVSVGVLWGKHWTSTDLETRYGARAKHDHNYPAYFPQAASNPQEINVYPVEALGEFRRWLQDVYLPDKFPTYLNAKVKKGLVAASIAELLLDEVADVPTLPSTSAPRRLT